MAIRSQSLFANEAMKVLRRCLRQVTISVGLSVRVQKQALERLRLQLPLSLENVDVLRMLSVSLRTKLKFELHGSHLKRQPLFSICAAMGPPAMQCICLNAVSLLVLACWDHVFLPGREAEARTSSRRGRSPAGKIPGPPASGRRGRSG